MITSLYQALKSAARVVRAFESAIPAPRVYARCRPGDAERRRQCRARPRALRLRRQILEEDLAAGPLLGADHDRAARAACVGQLELLAEGLAAQRELAGEAGVPELMRHREHLAPVL